MTGSEIRALIRRARCPEGKGDHGGPESHTLNSEPDRRNEQT